jgi:hypothetical protein
VGADVSGESSRASEDTSRRGLLTVMGAGGVAALATLVSSKEAQAGHDTTNVFHLGEVNTNPSNPTRLNAAAGEGAALEISGNPDGAGLIVNAGQSVFNGTGEAATLFVTAGGPDVPAIVVGGGETSGGQIEAQRGDLDEGVCITGVSGMDPPGGGPGTGVQGLSGTGKGVHGQSDSGSGVFGVSNSGIGVLGSSDSGPGGVFESNSGLALSVSGTAAFSSSGEGAVPAGQNSVFVAHDFITANSRIFVTLVSNPGSRVVSWVERDAGNGFTVHMSAASPTKRPETSFTYLVTEPTGPT